MAWSRGVGDDGVMVVLWRRWVVLLLWGHFVMFLTNVLHNVFALFCESGILLQFDDFITPQCQPLLTHFLWNFSHCCVAVLSYPSVTAGEDLRPIFHHFDRRANPVSDLLANFPRSLLVSGRLAALLDP